MKSFTEQQLKERAEAIERAASIVKRVISVLQQPCFVWFTDKETESYQISELGSVLGILEAAPSSSPDSAAVLIMRSELREWVEEELKELMDEMPPDSVVENLVDKLAQHFGNDLGQWEADNLKSFFNRDDVLKVVEV